MQEEKEVVQKELFGEFSHPTKGPGRFSWFGRPVSFRPLVFVFSYEKFIFLIIILLIALTIIFSLGVEQGKRIAQVVKPEAKASLTQVAPHQSGTEPALRQNETKPLPASAEASFTIQLASFTEKNLAEQEIAGLRNKGYQPFLATSGKYFIVCLGSFNDKEQAKLVLAKIKTIYNDAYIKKR